MEICDEISSDNDQSRKIVDQIYENENWEIFGTLFSMIKQQNERWDDLPKHKQNALRTWKQLETQIEHDGKLLLGSKFNIEEECCFVCGESDYEEGDYIGYCD